MPIYHMPTEGDWELFHGGEIAFTFDSGFEYNTFIDWVNQYAVFKKAFLHSTPNFVPPELCSLPNRLHVYAKNGYLRWTYAPATVGNLQCVGFFELGHQSQTAMQEEVVLLSKDALF